MWIRNNMMGIRNNKMWIRNTAGVSDSLFFHVQSNFVFLVQLPTFFNKLTEIHDKNKLKLQVLPMDCKLCCQPVATYMKIYNKP